MTETPRPAPTKAVRLERLLPAPIAEVFAAWTDPELMAQWLTPTGSAEVEADVRVGGQFRVTMIDGDFRLVHTGEYLAVEPPRRLSFTWRSPYTGPDASQVEVILTARGSATLLVLVHDRLPDETRSSHEGGWKTILERLTASLEHRIAATPERARGVTQ
ncbi:MAG TPA: SRPBCC domain-containing protein [Acidimicrobiales bacterium]|nr:SRPBCC domain-containing protein [Acidimicrobiales bacterium]